MAEAKSGQIVNVMKEDRLFPPPPEFAAKARIGSLEQYERLWHEAAGDIEGFWGNMAGELHWFKPYTRGARLARALRPVVRRRADQRLVQLPRRPSDTPRRNKAALIWEGEPGDVRVYTYEMLHREVCQFANVLKSLGIQQGRRGVDVHADGARIGHRHAGLRRIGAVHRWSLAALRPKPSPTATTTPGPS